MKVKPKIIKRFLTRNKWHLAKTRALELPWGEAEKVVARLILRGADPTLLEENFWRKNPKMLLFKQF